MENNEWVKQEPYVTDDGYYTPVNAYALSGGASMYRLTISREHFIECYNRWVKEEESSTLPDLDTFIEQNKRKNELVSPPRFRCPECGGNVRKLEGKVLLTNPPKYQYQCDDCHYYTILAIN